jgi:hypothetical protein
MIRHWVASHGELIAAGFKPPLPLEHTRDPAANRGEVVAMEEGTDAEGRASLYAKVRFADAEAEKLAARTNVSIYSPPSFEYAGRTFDQPITHVALTNYPVVPKLDGFQAIAASLHGEISMAIDWAPIQDALDLPEGVELTDDNAVELILVAIQNMKGDKPPEKKPPEPPKADAAGDAPPKADSPAKPPIAASFVNMLRDNRAMKLDRLVAEGKLTPVARKEIEKAHLTDGAISLSLGGVDDGFDRLCIVLSANAPCVPLKERTGAQTVALSHSHNPGTATNPLLADAQRRSEERAKRR